MNTVAQLMVEQGLVARRKRRRRSLTRPDRSVRKAPDLLRRDFRPPAAPNVAWVGDLTELPTDDGPFYLAAVLDLHSRRCVGFAMDAHHDAALAKAALCMAIATRGGDVKGVLFHTDQGGEYTGSVFATACVDAGVRQSMGRTGSALDNAVAESFNSTLEFDPKTFPLRRHLPGRLRTGRSPRAPSARTPAGGGMKPPLTTDRPCLAGDAPRGYGAAPPASRVATRSRSARRPCGPPLTPEPLRPLRQEHADRPRACPARARRTCPQIRSPRFTRK